MCGQPIIAQQSHARHAPVATCKHCSWGLSCDYHSRPISEHCSHDLLIQKVRGIVLSCCGNCVCKCDGKYLRLMTQGQKNFPTAAAIKRGCLAHDCHTQILLDPYTTLVEIKFNRYSSWRPQTTVINLRTTSAKF